jgi:hypothetical protein
MRTRIDVFNSKYARACVETTTHELRVVSTCTDSPNLG